MKKIASFTLCVSLTTVRVGTFVGIFTMLHVLYLYLYSYLYLYLLVFIFLSSGSTRRSSKVKRRGNYRGQVAARKLNMNIGVLVTFVICEQLSRVSEIRESRFAFSAFQFFCVLSEINGAWFKRRNSIWFGVDTPTVSHGAGKALAISTAIRANN